MDFLNSIFHFFTDKTRGLSSKAITTIIVVALIILIDNTLSFSYYYNTENKIEQVLSVNKLLTDTTLTKTENKKLLNIRKDIIDRKTWKDKTWDFVSNMDFRSENSLTENPTEKEIEIPISERSYLWHFISSSWLIVILMIAFPFVGILDKKTPFGQAIGILIILEPFLYGMAWISAKLFSFIPIILNNPTLNYILNAILCLGVFALFGIFGKKKTTANTV